MNESLPRFVSNPNPEIYLGNNYLVADFECSNWEYGTALDERNVLLLACWSVGAAHVQHGTRRVAVQWGDEFGQSALLSAIESADFVVAHHAKFEQQWLKRCGIDLRKLLCFDTMIAEKVIYGNIKKPLSLEATGLRRGLGQKEAVVAKLIKSGVCPTQIPAAMLESYCTQDVALTEQVFLAQRRELKELALLPVVYCRNLVTPVLADIEFNGMKLDKQRVHEAYEDYSQQYASVAEELSRLTGGINPKSPKQMREFVYEKLGFAELTDSRGNDQKTATGGAKVDKATLASLVASTDEQKAFKTAAVALAKLKVPVQNLTKMMKICEENPDDPRVFASFNQTVTQTDRLSSTARNGGFNFQNLDRAFKRLFRARAEGRVICEADAPQLEFRVAAFLGNDAQAKADIRDGVDVHAATAATLGTTRQNAKAFTFKPLYGGNSGTPREKKYYKYFRDRYDGIYRTQVSWTMEVVQRKSLTTATGLRFYWPDTEITRSGYVTNTTSIFNYSIQSLATSDIMPLVLCLIWHRVGSLGDAAVLANTIHDSVVADVQADALPDYEQIVVDCFTRDIYPLLDRLYGIKFDIALGVGIKAGEFWSEGAEKKFEPTLKTH